MKADNIQQELLRAGLHEESVDRLVDNFQSMQFHLRQSNYEEAGGQIGNFCENMVNILRDKMGQGVVSNPQVGTFVKQVTSGKFGTNEPKEARLLVPRTLRAAYDIRNNRDSVHVNLNVPVNHSDTQTGVRLCSWMLAELLRIYGDMNDMDTIANIITNLSDPHSSYIDEYDGRKMIQSTELDIKEEILVHLYYQSGREVDADKLVTWIPGANSRQVKGTLGRLKQSDNRLVWYKNGTACITSLGAEQAREIIEEKLSGNVA